MPLPTVGTRINDPRRSLAGMFIRTKSRMGLALSPIDSLDRGSAWPEEVVKITVSRMQVAVRAGPYPSPFWRAG